MSPGKGGSGVFLVYPPGRKFFENTPPPGDFEKIRHFVPEIEEKPENFT